MNLESIVDLCAKCFKHKIKENFKVMFTDMDGKKIYFCSLKCFEDYNFSSKLVNGRLTDYGSKNKPR